jgi:hypothetical protein
MCNMRCSEYHVMPDSCGSDGQFLVMPVSSTQDQLAPSRALAVYHIAANISSLISADL